MQHPQEESRKPIGKILQKHKPFTDARIRISQDFTFYGVTKSTNGTPDISIAFKITKASGEQIIIQYHELISPMLFDGATTITLNTLSLKIIIKGKHLEPLIDYLAEHRLMWIKEPDSDFMQVKEGEVVVGAITIDVK